MTQRLFDRFSSRLLFYGLLLTLFFLILSWASPHLRGSDQYWYVGQAERVVLGDGQFKSNSIFPLSMPEDLTQLPRPWVQNGPASYVVLPFTYLTGNGHLAWLILNTICLFISAVLIARSLKLNAENSFWFTGIFMFFPFNFYLASQALPELFVMLLISSVMFLMLRKPSIAKALLTAIAVGILCWQRSNYVLLLVLVPIVYAVAARKKALFPALAFLIVGLTTVSCSSLFDDHLVKSPGFKDIILLNKQGGSNMGAFLHPYDNSNLSWADVVPVAIEKAGGALRTQFEVSTPSTTLMFYTINLMFPAFLIFIFRREPNLQTKLTLSVLVGIHLATIVLFYNQYRYAASIIPALFYASVFVVRRYHWSRRSVMKMASVACVLFMSLGLGWQLRSQTIQEYGQMNYARKILQSKTVNALMCEYASGAGLQVGYMVDPKPTFFFPSDYPLEKWLETARKLRTKHGVVFSRTGIYAQLKPRIKSEVTFPDTNMIFFEIDTNEQK